MSYNTAVALLHAGQNRLAFDRFHACLPWFRASPHLWLHVAECCIQVSGIESRHDKQFILKVKML